MPDLRSHTDYFLHLLASLAAVTAAVYACVHIVACDYCMREAKKKQSQWPREMDLNFISLSFHLRTFLIINGGFNRRC